ncbi:MAG: 4-hydroxy-3-methylbut-2-enyl diphosphate reductase, partial [Selenomonadaceae bacterium]|nr:4-hydroxy-3-methylbut-2-enyl diphosphate reductase [Selenomonadaceae bacterium]
MEVILADYLGFCYGVKRAIKIARENASEEPGA